MFFIAAAITVLICATATVVLTNGYARAESTASIPPLVLTDTSENLSAEASSDGAAGDSTTQQLAETVVGDQGLAEGGSSAHAADASLRLLREREARERERRRAEEMTDSWPSAKSTSPAESPAPATAANATKKPDAPKSGPKTVTVQVTYDEAGRVTQASGSDPTALRIARQKRFPSGKPGTTTITIPIN